MEKAGETEKGEEKKVRGKGGNSKDSKHEQFNSFSMHVDPNNQRLEVINVKLLWHRAQNRRGLRSRVYWCCVLFLQNADTDIYVSPQGKQRSSLKPWVRNKFQ